jgi:hypothetical protein
LLSAASSHFPIFFHSLSLILRQMITYGTHMDEKLLPSSNDDLSNKTMNQPFYKKFFALLATLASFATLIVTVHYAHGSNLHENYLGGLDFQKLIFNYHPVFMVAGFIVCFINATLSFLYLPFEKQTNKMIHAILHTGAIVFIILGLSCVIIGEFHERLVLDLNFDYYCA